MDTCPQESTKRSRSAQRRVGGVVLQEPGPEHVGGRGLGHGRARVAAVGFLDGVHGQAAHGVDAEFVDVGGRKVKGAPRKSSIIICTIRRASHSDAGLHEGREQRVGLQGLGLELGVELAAQEVGVVRQLDDLHEGAVRAHAGEGHALGLQGPAEVRLVELVAVAVALADLQACRRPGRPGCPPPARRGRRPGAWCRPAPPRPPAPAA